MFSISFSLMLKNPNKATGGGALESTENATITNGECLGDYIEVKDELLTPED